MRSYDGTPMICSGSVIRFKPSGMGFLGSSGFSTQVDQTPVEVQARLAGAEGLVEFSYHGVAVYVDATEAVATITPTFDKVAADES